MPTTRKELILKAETLSKEAREMKAAAGFDDAGNSKMTNEQLAEFQGKCSAAADFINQEKILAGEEMISQLDHRLELVNALPAGGGAGKSGDYEIVQGKSLEEGFAGSIEYQRSLIGEGKDQFSFAHSMSRGQEIFLHSDASPLHVMNAGRVARYRGKESVIGRAEGKANPLSTSTGIAPFSYPIAGYTMMPQEVPTLLDVMTQTNSEDQLVTFLRQNQNTNSAAVVTEGGAKPQGGMKAAYVTKKFCVISELFQVTEQDLRFVRDALRTFTEQGTLHVRETVQNQIINGTGSGANDTAMEGFLNATGKLTQAAVVIASGSAGQVAGETIAFGGAQVNSNAYAAANVARANTVIVNPQDLIIIKTAKTTQNQYLWNTTEQIKGFWGVPNLVETGYIAHGTAVIADLSQKMAEFFWSGMAGVNVVVGYQTGDFETNLRTIRFEAWGVSAIKQPASICVCTLA